MGMGMASHLMLLLLLLLPGMVGGAMSGRGRVAGARAEPASARRSGGRRGRHTTGRPPDGGRCVDDVVQVGRQQVLPYCGMDGLLLLLRLLLPLLRLLLGHMVRCMVRAAQLCVASCGHGAKAACGAWWLGRAWRSRECSSRRVKATAGRQGGQAGADQWVGGWRAPSRGRCALATAACSGCWGRAADALHERLRKVERGRQAPGLRHGRAADGPVRQLVGGQEGLPAKLLPAKEGAAQAAELCPALHERPQATWRRRRRENRAGKGLA